MRTGNACLCMRNHSLWPKKTIMNDKSCRNYGKKNKNKLKSYKMIQIKKLEKILSLDLDLNLVTLLQYVSQGANLQSLMDNQSRVVNWMLTLERKGYIVRIKDYQYELTVVGRDALDEIGKVKIVDDTPTVLATAEEPIQTVTTDNTATAILGNLHKELQNKLFELTGMRQAKGYSNSSFIPSARDLEYQLIKFKRVYKELWDVNKIRKCLIAHVETCARTSVYTPVLKYYIFKDEKGSQLAADLEAYQETTETQHKIKNTKDMFG